jgi:hypothetical protein
MTCPMPFRSWIHQKCRPFLDLRIRETRSTCCCCCPPTVVVRMFYMTGYFVNGFLIVRLASVGMSGHQNDKRPPSRPLSCSPFLIVYRPTLNDTSAYRRWGDALVAPWALLCDRSRSRLQSISIDSISLLGNGQSMYFASRTSPRRPPSQMTGLTWLWYFRGRFIVPTTELVGTHRKVQFSLFPRKYRSLYLQHGVQVDFN